MIHYVEGFPGLGKTYFSVVILAERIKKNRSKTYQSIVSNVRGYKADDFDIDDIERPNSLYIIDEIQKFNKYHDKLFLHLCEHRHLGQDWIIMTQCKDAIPRKFMGLLERSYCLEPIAGSSFTRAVTRIGKPIITNKMVISNETFQPKKTDVYQTVSEGAEIPKRKMPMKYILIFAALPVMIFITVFWAMSSIDRFTGSDEAVASVVEPPSVVSEPLDIKDVLQPVSVASDDIVCPDKLPDSLSDQLIYLDCHPETIVNSKIIHSHVNGHDIYHFASSDLSQFIRSNNKMIMKRFAFDDSRRKRIFLDGTGNAARGVPQSVVGTQ